MASVSNVCVDWSNQPSSRLKPDDACRTVCFQLMIVERDDWCVVQSRPCA